MTAKALLVRPNMAVLCLLGTRLPHRSFLPSMVTPTESRNLCVGPSLSKAKLRFSSFSRPISRSFCVRATTDPDNSASVESGLIISMEKKIKERLSADSVVVKDAYGDGRHVRCGLLCTMVHGELNILSIKHQPHPYILNKLTKALLPPTFVIKHVFCSIEVISSAFEGQSAVNRQRMVYKAIWEELQDRVHAVDQMTTRTPSEASGK